jgi:hypothetical protein
MPAINALRAPTLVFAALFGVGLAWPLAGRGQEAAAPSRIEQQMTPEQFRAAGLDRLTPEQLANLNAWLNRTLVAETQKAAAWAKQKVQDDSRGFLSFGSSEPILSRVSGEFRGFAQGRRHVLANGQEWEQVDAASLAGVRLAEPEVKIIPSMVGNAWYMQVGKYGTRAKVRRIK